MIIPWFLLRKIQNFYWNFPRFVSGKNASFNSVPVEHVMVPVEYVVVPVEHVLVPVEQVVLLVEHVVVPVEDVVVPVEQGSDELQISFIYICTMYIYI